MISRFNAPGRNVFLSTSKTFPTELPELTNSINKMYIEVAQSVNRKTSGIYEKAPTVSGNDYFLEGNPIKSEQSYRFLIDIGEIVSGGTFTLPMPILDIKLFVKIECVVKSTAGMSFSLPYFNFSGGSTTNWVRTFVSSSNEFTVQVGSTGPSISRGIGVLEFLRGI